MTKSKNYGFNLPSRDTDDIADINQIAENFEIIDKNLYAVAASAGEAAGSAEEAKGYAARAYELVGEKAPVIKCHLNGTAVAANDVSPIEHDLKVKLSSDTITDFSSVKVEQYGLNLLPFPYTYNKNTYDVGYSFTTNGVTFTVLEQGRIKIKGTAEGGSANFNIGKFKNPTISLTSGKGYSSSKRLSWNTNQNFVFVNVGVGNTVDEILEPLVVKGEYSKDAMPAFEPYKEPQIATANADGTVEGLKSISPNMTLIPDTEGVNIECEYKADTKLYIDNKFAELAAAIVSNS